MNRNELAAQIFANRSHTTQPTAFCPETTKEQIVIALAMADAFLAACLTPCVEGRDITDEFGPSNFHGPVDLDFKPEVYHGPVNMPETVETKADPPKEPEPAVTFTPEVKEPEHKRYHKK